MPHASVVWRRYEHSLLAISPVIPGGGSLSGRFQPSPPPAAPLAADSPLLYQLFFRFHHDFDKWLSAGRSSAPASAASLDAGAAGLLGVRTGDLAALSTVSQSVASSLETIAQAERTYVNTCLKREQRPDPSTLAQYRQQREAAIAKGMTALRQSLPSGSYTALLGFINGRFRASHRTAGQP